MSDHAKCRGCGRPIIWIEYDGNKIPVDPKPTTFRYVEGRWIRSDAYVVHNALCPESNKFTDRKE